MKDEELEKSLRECFRAAEKDEKKGRKHKGLLLAKPDDKAASEYIKKAKNILRYFSDMSKTGTSLTMTKNLSKG